MLLVLGARSRVHDGLVCMQPELPMLVRALKHGVEVTVSRQISAPHEPYGDVLLFSSAGLFGFFFVGVLADNMFPWGGILRGCKTQN